MKRSILTVILTILIASGMMTADIWAQESADRDGEIVGQEVYETEMYDESDTAESQISAEVQEESFDSGSGKTEDTDEDGISVNEASVNEASVSEASVNEASVSEAAVSEVSVEEKYENKGVYEFVKRMYTVALGRDYDPEGLEDWYHCLINKENTGTKVAEGFVFSDEFVKKAYNNEQYLDVLYRTFLGREADSEGKAAWLNCLNHSVSRRAVFNGFANSVEFRKICSSYGISAGTAVSADICDTNNDVTMFVHRCYEKFLGRKPDTEGLRNWVRVLVSHKESPQRVVYGFVFSKEFSESNIDNDTFVATLYRGLFDREPDSAGFKAWISTLESDKSRLHVFKGFVFSDEFKKMISRFGLSMGSDSLSDIQDSNDLLSNIRAEAYMAVDEKNGEVLISKNAGKTMQLASQTKLMTALVVLEHVSDLNTPVQMTEEVNEMIDWDATRAGLEEGRSYTVRTLLEGMLVYSGGDCANLLAIYVGGTQQHFVEMMNEKAKQMGMAYTYFSDPVGLHDNHSTTTQYIKLAVAARNNPLINEMTKMPFCVIRDVDGSSERKLANSNALVSGALDYDKALYTVDGLKTGYTEEAGYCLTTSSYNGMGSRVITVILNTLSGLRAIDSKYLLDVVYSNNLRGYYSLTR